MRTVVVSLLFSAATVDTFGPTHSSPPPSSPPSSPPECPDEGRLSHPAVKPTFPDPDLYDTSDPDTIADFFATKVATIPMVPPPTMTPRQIMLAKLSAGEFMSMRKSGEVTCEEYAEVLTMRAIHYKYMGQFMYWDNMPNQMEDVVMKAAKADDKKADEEGVEALAPLYCLPVPVKGTIATKEFRSSMGSGVLHDYKANEDAEVIKLLKKHGGIIFGKTNAPEFAGSHVTCNYANGCTLNAYGHHFSVGGSSGGSASAVASYIAPVAITGDAGGSTRHPANQNQNFGYDPSSNHYPNAGIPGMTYTHDNTGLNTRTFADILAFDAAVLNISSEHADAAAKARPITMLKVGTPVYPFVEWYTYQGALSPPHLFWPNYPDKWVVSEGVMAKYEKSIAAMKAAGAQMIAKEWPTAVSDGVSYNGAAVALLAKFVPWGEPWGDFPYDFTWEMYHSYTGTASEWVRHYLNASVGANDIAMDMTPFPGHNPRMLFTIAEDSGQPASRFRWAMGPYVTETIDAYNSIFDEYDLDVIFMPAQSCDALTYEGIARSTLSQRVNQNGRLMVASDHTQEMCNQHIFHAFKNIPVPKITVPVGTDAAGNMVSVQFWGRAGPKNAKDTMWAYDDVQAKTADLGFLYAVKPLVEAIASDPSLVRVEAPLVTGAGNLFS